MRVRISYGMDIEDVPSRASELLYDTVEKLQATLALLEWCRDGVEDCTTDFKHITGSLDKARLSLGALDQSIQDVEYILEGLNNYYNGEQQDVSEGRSTMDSSGNTTEET
jgi:hypothetical protein